MATINTRLQAMTRRMLYKAAGGAQVTFQRVTGLAPSTTLVSATVTALVRNAQPDGDGQKQAGYAGQGAIAVTGRQIFVMATDLAAKGFPLPLKAGDNALVADTGEKLKLTPRLDATKRAISGCIEAYGVTA